MFGQHAFASVGFGDSANTAPATVPATQPSTTVSFTTARKATYALFEGPVQSLQLHSGPTVAQTLGAVGDAFGNVFLNEQPADAAATDTRNIDAFSPAQHELVQEIGVVFDSDIIASPVDAVELVVKRCPDAGPVSDALTAALSSTFGGFAARTKYTFTWLGNFELSPTDVLIVAVTKPGLGRLLPKFEIVGSTRQL